MKKKEFIVKITLLKLNITINLLLDQKLSITKSLFLLFIFLYQISNT